MGRSNSLERRRRLTLVEGERSEHFTVESESAEKLMTNGLAVSKLLICTKAQDTIPALQPLLPTIDRTATVIVLQNGMAAEELPTLLPTQRLIHAITSDGAYRTAADTVVLAGRGQTWVGADSSLRTELPSALDIQCCDDIERRKWQKLAVNCAINGLTAIHHCRNGELLDKPDAVQAIAEICRELKALSAAGVAPELGDIEALVEKTLRETANNYSSMYQDVANRRTTEIDYLNGYICKLAKQAELACPANLKILDQIQALTNSSNATR